MAGDVSYTFHSADVSLQPDLGVGHVWFGERKSAARAQQSKDRVECHGQVQVMQDTDTHNGVVAPSSWYPLSRFRVANEYFGGSPDSFTTNACGIGTQFQGFQVTSG